MRHHGGGDGPEEAHAAGEKSQQDDEALQDTQPEEVPPGPPGDAPTHLHRLHRPHVPVHDAVPEELVSHPPVDARDDQQQDSREDQQAVENRAHQELEELWIAHPQVLELRRLAAIETQGDADDGQADEEANYPVQQREDGRPEIDLAPVITGGRGEDHLCHPDHQQDQHEEADIGLGRLPAEADGLLLQELLLGHTPPPSVF